MGTLTVITGPMKSGKSKRLIEEYDKIQNKNKCLVAKPIIDNRFSESEIISRDGGHIKAINIDNMTDLYQYTDEYNIFIIDEIQFIEDAIIGIKFLLDMNKDIIVSGLNLTSEMRPFNHMGDILCFADNIIVLKGHCDICAEQYIGKYTYYDGDKNTTILVGDNKYKCVCQNCYNLLNNKRLCK